MNAMTEMTTWRHEKVLFVNNEKAGLKAIIAVHNTNLGPAIGGCRLFPYASYDDALFDVLRLSRGMSHKNAIAGLPHGGGKGVIIADPSMKTEAMFEAFGYTPVPIYHEREWKIYKEVLDNAQPVIKNDTPIYR